MKFVPGPSKKSAVVPYYEDAHAQAGWAGQATRKNISQLRTELMYVITERLGGTVTTLQEGVFQDGLRSRDGLRIFYVLEVEGVMHQGRIDAAALPVRRSGDREASKKMMLYMLRDALNGLWYLQQLSPGYAALMPFLLVDGEQTVTQVWSDRANLGLLLPSPGSTFIEGEYLVE